MKLASWRELPEGGLILCPGNTVEVKTGTWRVLRPVIDFERCVHCLICWVFCPDSCYIVEDSRIAGIDYDHCKGCGICAVECPKKCIEMVEERE
jgi:pyruvate ferredoxin oxidoreductase delta subunit